MSLDHKQYREMIESYHQGSSDAEKHALELLAMDDPFLADALDGYENIPDHSLLDEVNERITNPSPPQTPFLSKFILPFAVLAVIGIAIKPSNSPQGTDHAAPIAITEVVVENRKTVLDEYHIVTATVEHKKLPEVQWIQNLPEEQIAEIDTIQPTPIITVPEPISTIQPAKIDSSVKQEEVQKTKHPAYYLYDLKVANYDGFRETQQESEQLHNSLLAKFEDETRLREMESEKTITLSYTDFLGDCMYYFSKNEFGRAIEGFDIILSTYPDDVNALFYSGLAHYNLDNAEKSVELFQAALQHPYFVFEDASEWYLGLSMLKTGRKSVAKNIISKIAREDGFYSEKAKLQLLKLEKN